uniref:Uncharacterized protein n=1 Tax=Romanomermis culicivorax TaxID=13658 RepID=A0A915HMD5_ROMCU
ATLPNSQHDLLNLLIFSKFKHIYTFRDSLHILQHSRKPVIVQGTYHSIASTMEPIQLVESCGATFANIRRENVRNDV